MEVRIKDLLLRQLHELTDMSDQIDKECASARIKDNIWFRGPNVWILALSIVIASVGLNVNSTAVIIGAMLISPLMGPIVGVGFSLGTNDLKLLTSSAKNLLVMVAISLTASFLFFLLSPLELVNPTELQARTSPTIFDVLIAFFGGLAGILETCRKERGTVLSGVAIATALMPPLCTAGYGLANLNLHFFFGAMFLFIINGVFIIFATVLMVKYFKFESVSSLDPETDRRIRSIISLVLVAVMVPSLVTAASLVRRNNYEHKVINLVSENKAFGRKYVYDYEILPKRDIVLHVTGEAMSASDSARLRESAVRCGIKPEKIRVNLHSIGPDMDIQLEKAIREIYKMTEQQLATKDAELDSLRTMLETVTARIDSLAAPKDTIKNE